MIRPRTRRRAPRGTTLLEVIIAMTILLVAMLGFVGTATYAATATGVAHRRTSSTFLRGGLIDRLTVTPRSALTALPAGAWVIDACYGADAQLVPGGANYPAYSTTFACPAGSMYRSWVRATANDPSSWTVNLYVERTDGGCKPAARASSTGCSSADLLLTD